MNSLNISLSEGLILWNVLCFLLNIAALCVTIVKPGKNAQTIRAIAVVGAFTFRFWLGLTSIVWALIDVFFPNISIKIPEVKKGKK